jgi:O-antigen/teichoic acid export membrane protein
VTHYGAFAYGLSVVAFLQLFATLGVQDAISRYVPIYYENGEYDKLFGTIFLAAGIIFGTGILVVATVVGSPGFLSRFLTHEQLTLRLLPILIFLVPVEAADAILDGLFASFTSAGAIFVRKYILGPGLKLGVVVLLIWRNATVVFLAYGYVLASVLGVVMYCWMYLLLLHKQQLLRHINARRVKIPAQEILAFVIPGLSSLLATVAIPTVSILLLGAMGTMSDVAYYRVVLPLAQLNGIVMASFTLLYTPAAARLFAKAHFRAISTLYWKTAAWMSVLSFPIFAATFSFAKPLTVFMYGIRYEPSVPVLALLSLASYFNTSLGFNLQTLKVLGQLRFITFVSVLSVVIDIALNMLLIPRFGALGAAMSSAAAAIIYNLLLQLGLFLTSKFSAFDRRYLSIYVTVGLSAWGLLAVQNSTSMNLYLGLPLAGVVSLCVVAIAKRKLRIAETFPELLNLPFARLILS